MEFVKFQMLKKLLFTKKKLSVKLWVLFLFLSDHITLSILKRGLISKLQDRFLSLICRLWEDGQKYTYKVTCDSLKIYLMSCVITGPRHHKNRPTTTTWYMYNTVCLTLSTSKNHPPYNNLNFIFNFYPFVKFTLKFTNKNILYNQYQKQIFSIV